MVGSAKKVKLSLSLLRPLFHFLTVASATVYGFHLVMQALANNHVVDKLAVPTVAASKPSGLPVFFLFLILGTISCPSPLACHFLPSLSRSIS